MNATQLLSLDDDALCALFHSVISTTLHSTPDTDRLRSLCLEVSKRWQYSFRHLGPAASAAAAAAGSSPLPRAALSPSAASQSLAPPRGSGAALAPATAPLAPPPASAPTLSADQARLLAHADDSLRKALALAAAARSPTPLPPPPPPGKAYVPINYPPATYKLTTVDQLRTAAEHKLQLPVLAVFHAGRQLDNPLLTLVEAGVPAKTVITVILTQAGLEAEQWGAASAAGSAAAHQLHQQQHHSQQHHSQQHHSQQHAVTASAQHSSPTYPSSSFLQPQHQQQRYMFPQSPQQTALPSYRIEVPPSRQQVERQLQVHSLSIPSSAPASFAAPPLNSAGGGGSARLGTSAANHAAAHAAPSPNPAMFVTASYSSPSSSSAPVFLAPVATSAAEKPSSVPASQDSKYQTHIKNVSPPRSVVLSFAAANGHGAGDMRADNFTSTPPSEPES
jgi:hypothetical protein